MVLKRGGRGGKPKRGGSHRFSSSRDPNAYITSRPPRPEYDESDSEDGSEEDQVDQQITQKVAVINIGSTKDDTDSEEDGESESEEEGGKDAKAGKSEAQPAAPKKDDKPRELTRREREALEKERARQHFLKMKAKEESERLAAVRRQREEAAAAHAAALKEKEDARLARRSGL